MIIYNVTVKIEHALHDDWLAWMKMTHIPDVMATGIFSDQRFCRVLVEDADGVTYAVQYTCPSLAEFERYERDFAPRLRDEHARRYANRFVAFRTLLEVVE